MIPVEKIRALVEEKIAGTDVFITDITVGPGNKIQVSIDKMNGGIVISDCVQLSRHIEANLDRNIEDYQLDVSSAGMETPFKVKQQYFKNTGRKVEAVTTDGMRYEGKLLSANEEGIEIETTHRDKQLKKEVTEIKRLSYNQIRQTKKIISFK